VPPELKTCFNELKVTLSFRFIKYESKRIRSVPSKRHGFLFRVMNDSDDGPNVTLGED